MSSPLYLKQMELSSEGGSAQLVKLSALSHQLALAALGISDDRSQISDAQFEI